MCKKVKRLLALLGCLVLCIGLCACGDKKSSEDEYLDGDCVEITFWHSYGTTAAGFIQEIADKFNMSQDEYFVVLENQGDVSSIRSKMDSTKKEYYPSLITGQPLATAYYENADYVKPMQYFIDNDDEDWTSGVFESVRSTYSDAEGNMIGYPLGVSCSGYWVNVDAVKKAGYTLEDLTSFEKIAEVSKAVVSKGICQYGISFFGSGVELLDMMTIEGAYYVDAENGYEGKPTKSVLLEGKNKKAMKKASEIYAELYASDSAVEYGSAPGTVSFPLFNDEKCAMVYATHSYGVYVFPSNPDFEYVFLPSVGITEQAKHKGSIIPEGTGFYVVDTGNEKEMQGAYEFVKFFSQVENQSYWCQGEGYVPFTTEAAEYEEYKTWMQEYMACNQSVIDTLKESKAIIRAPYVECFTEVLGVSRSLFENVAYDPKGDLNKYMKEAAYVLEEGMEIWLERQ